MGIYNCYIFNNNNHSIDLGGYKMKAYCMKCEKEQQSEIVIMNKSSGTINKILKYPLKMMFCKVCGDRIYTSEIIDENLEAFNKAYNKAWED